MKALILAAGRGHRLGVHTANQPKCLTHLSGRPLLEWQLEAIRAIGISSIGIVTGYRSESLHPFGLQEFHNPLWSETNMVSSLLCAESWFKDESCIVSYSDIVYRSSHLQALRQAPGEVVITYDKCWFDLWKVRMDNPLDDAESFVLNEQGRLKTIGERTQDITQIQGQFMGLAKFTPTGFSRLSEWLRSRTDLNIAKLDFTKMLRLSLEDGFEIGLQPVEAGWCEVDTIEDRDRYEALLRVNESFSHDWRQ